MIPFVEVRVSYIGRGTLPPAPVRPAGIRQEERTAIKEARVKTYTITCYDWETYCQNCGSDLLIGDKVTMDRDENTFCGIECVRMYGEYMRSRELHVRAA